MAPNFTKLSMKKDLCEIYSNNVKPSKHCSDVVKKTNKPLGFNKRTFEYNSAKNYSCTI